MCALSAAARFYPCFFGADGVGVFEDNFIVVVRAVCSVLALPEEVEDSDFSVSEGSCVGVGGNDAAEVVNGVVCAVNV